MGAFASRPATHRSLNSRTATTVEFCNETCHEVETLWLDFDGVERHYYTLQPGQRVRQATFTAHPWVFRVPGAPREQPVVQDQAVFYAPPLPGPTAPAMETRIRAAAGMRWSPASHAAFPSDFRAAAGALLCCHQRLAACRSSAATSTDATERRGCWLRHLSRQLSAQGAPACKRVGQGKGAAQRHQQSCCLGDLTKDVLLDVLAAAAPFVPLVLKPALPHGVDPRELSSHRLQLFQQAEGADSRGGPAQAAAGAEAGQPNGLAGAGQPAEAQ